MLRYFRLQGSFTNAEFVEVGCEPQDVNETPDIHTHTYLPLSDAIVQMFNSDSQVQERLQGDSLLQGFRQHSSGRHENSSAPANHQSSTHLAQDGGVNASLVGKFASSASASHAEHPVTTADPVVNITTPTLTQPQDIGASHQEEPHAGPANRTGVKPMQPWSMTAITGGDPLMRQQPSEDPLFLRGDSDMPRPQQRQQQPSRARARPRQPAGQGQRQQVGSFRAPRPSAGRACNSLPFPPQQAEDVGGFKGIFRTANDAPIDHSRTGMAQAAKLLGLEQPDQDILPETYLLPLTCLPDDAPHSFSCDATRSLQHDGPCPSFVGAHNIEPGQQSAAWASHAAGPLQQVQSLGVNRADPARDAPSALPQAAQRAPASHEGSQLPASSHGQPGHEPESPAQVNSAVQGQGDCVGSAGIAMSPWCDSQLWALASCPQAQQQAQQHGPALDLPDEPAHEPQVNRDGILDAAPLVIAQEHQSREQHVEHQGDDVYHQFGSPHRSLLCGEAAASSANEEQDTPQHLGSAGHTVAVGGAPVMDSPTQLESPDAVGQGRSPQQHVHPPEAEMALNLPPPAPRTIHTALAGTHAAEDPAAPHEAGIREGSGATSMPQQRSGERADESAALDAPAKSDAEAHGDAEHARLERRAIPATLPEEGCPGPQGSVPASPSGEHADAQPGGIPATLAEALDWEGQGDVADHDRGAEMAGENSLQTEEALPFSSRKIPAPPPLQATIEELCPTAAAHGAFDEAEGNIQQSSGPSDGLQADGLRKEAAAQPAPAVLASMWSTASGGPLQVSAEATRIAQAPLHTTPEMAPDKTFQVPPPPAEALQLLPENCGPALWSSASGMPANLLEDKVTVAPAACGNDRSPAWRPLSAAAEAQGQLSTGSAAPVWGTASGKPVHFSREKMAAAAAIFGDELPTALTPPPAAHLQAPHGGAPSLWGTASGKPLEISKDRMAVAAAMFGDDLPTALTPPPAAQHRPPHSGAPSLWGTASGMPLEISRERMAAAAAMFGNDLPTALTPPPAAQLQPPTGGALSLWGTASGKPLEISKDKMAAAAAIFGNDLSPALSPSPPAAAGAFPDAAATISWASGPAKASDASKKGVAIAEENTVAAEQHSVKTMQPGSPSGALSRQPSALGAAEQVCNNSDSLQTLHRSASHDAMANAESTPVQTNTEAGAALSWQTASGKRMRVSPEGLAAAASLLHRTPEPLCADAPQTVPPSGVQGVGHGQADVKGSADTADLGHSAGGAALLDPGTPMQSCPAASAGPLSTGTTGRKRSAVLRLQQRPGPTHSKGKGGSSFKAPRKFETPVSKFVLQQGCRNATPSRLQQSSAAAPRQPVHDLQGTLAGKLLAEAGYTGSRTLADTCSHPDPAVASMSSRTAASYAVTDASEGRAEAAAFVLLLRAAGADAEHCSEAWVANHYRWIVWKLACYERRLPQQLAGRMLTVPVVLDQLKYRYEREYGKGQRSVLKKVLEQDERASRAMILCVAEVLRPSSAQQGGEEQVQLEVTDGWYSVSASIDGPLRQCLASGVLRTGMKLRVCGAELRGGQPEAVLEASRSCCLHLRCNGTHRANADAKLGWTPYQSVVVPLSAIRLGGGIAPRTAVVVQRRFPALYWDTLSDGRSMRRTARAKAAADRMAEGHAEKGTEDAVAQIQAEERSHCRQLLAETKSSNPVPEGAVLYANQILSGESPGELAQQATRDDMDKADRYRAGRDAVMHKRKEELMHSSPSMHVVRSNRLLPLLVSPLLPKAASGREQCSMRAIIEVSNPTEDVEALAEGCCCLVTDLSAPAKQRSTGPLLLRTSARTLWQLIPPAEAQAAYSWECEPRQRARLADMGGGLPGHLFDYDGLVLGAGDRLLTGGAGQAQQWLFLTDDSTDCFAQSPDLACAPRILAVQLQAQEEAIDFISPALDVGSIASLRDLQLGFCDAANNLWRAHGTDHTAIQLQPVQSLSRTTVGAGSATQRLAQWALSNQAVIAAMQAAVQRILCS